MRAILEILGLEKQGKVAGFDDWLTFIRSQNKQRNDLINLIAELQEAKRLTSEIRTFSPSLETGNIDSTSSSNPSPDNQIQKKRFLEPNLSRFPTSDWIKNDPMIRRWAREEAAAAAKSSDISKTAPSSIQAKLTVSTPGDKYELEADAMAAKVMAMPHTAIEPQQEAPNPTNPSVQRAVNEDKTVSTQLENRIQNATGGSPLPSDIRSFMEPRFGVDFSEIRVHTDSNAAAMCKEVGAKAFAVGNRIYYGAEYSPGNNELTAHELTHTIQQGAAKRFNRQVRPLPEPSEMLVAKKINISLPHSNKQKFQFPLKESEPQPQVAKSTFNRISRRIALQEISESSLPAKQFTSKSKPNFNRIQPLSAEQLSRVQSLPANQLLSLKTYKNHTDAVATKVAAGESTAPLLADFSEQKTDSGERQLQGKSPTDQYSDSSHLSQVRANLFDEALRFNSLGSAQYKQGNYPEALKYFEKVVKLTPNYSVVWYNQGLALFRLNRLQEAFDSYQTALAINNWSPVQTLSWAWHNIGIIYYNWGRFHEAFQCFQRAVALDPGNERAKTNLKLSANPSLRNQSNTSNRDHPVERFQQRLKQKAIQQLGENYGLIVAAQQKYQNSDAGTLGRLRQVVEADERLKEAQDLLTIRQRTNLEFWRDKNETPVLKDKSDQSERQALIVQNNTKLDEIKQMRSTLLALYPASGLLEARDLKEANSDAKLLATLNDRFKDILENIFEAIKRVNSGDIPLLQLEPLIQGTLKETPEADITAINQYLQSERGRENTFRLVGFLAQIGLTVGAIFTGGFVGVVMGAIATATGIGQAAYEFEEAEDLNVVAKTGQAGGNQLLTDPGEARFNYIMGLVNLLLAAGIIDVVVFSVKRAGALSSRLRGAERIVNLPGGEVLARVTPEQIRNLERSRQLEQARKIDEAEAIVAQLRQELGETTYNQLKQVWDEAATSVQRIPSATTIGQLRQRLPNRIGLVESSQLENGQVRVSYTKKVVKIEYAPNASLDDIRVHVPTALDLLEIKDNQNLAGKLLNELNLWLGQRRANAYPRAVEVQKEIEKHINIIYQNAREVASLPPNSAEAQELLSQIANYQEEIAHWQNVLVNEVDRSLGVGYVAGGKNTNRQSSIRINEQGQINAVSQGASGAIQVSATELRALKTITSTQFQNLIASLGHKNVITLIQRLDGVWFTRIYTTTGGGEDALRVVLEILDLEAKGKVAGFDDWLKFARSKNKQGVDLINVIAELPEAKRLSSEIRADEVINVGGDGQVVPRRDGSNPPSYDITVASRRGQVRRNIDVTTIDKVVIDEKQFTDGIKHAIDKIEVAEGLERGATVEATIRVEIPNTGSVFSIPGNKEKHFGVNGRYTITDPGGTPRRIGTNPAGQVIYELEGDLFNDLAEHITKNNVAANEHLDYINIVDKSGKPIAIVEKIGRTWKAKRISRS